MSVNGQGGFQCLYFKVRSLKGPSCSRSSFAETGLYDVSLKSGKYEALYENIPLKEQLPGPYCAIEPVTLQEMKAEMKNGSNLQLAAVRIHKKKRIKNKTVLAYSLLTIVKLLCPPPSSSPDVSYPSSVFLCFLSSLLPPLQPLFACVSVFKKTM